MGPSHDKLDLEQWEMMVKWLSKNNPLNLYAELSKDMAFKKQWPFSVLVNLFFLFNPCN